MEQELRIDKWLWSVRVFKTRSIATEACRAGKIRAGDHVIKPAHIVRPGDLIHVSLAPILRTLKVIALPPGRVSAKLVPEFMEDLTPESEYAKLRQLRETGFEFRPKGIGRPTKRERREIEFLKYYLGE